MTQLKPTGKSLWKFNTDFEMRILVTGATGFVGKTLIQRMSESNFPDVAITVRDNNRARLMFSKLPLKYIAIDENLAASIRSFNPEIVIHLAAYFTGRSDNESIDALVDANIKFPTHVLEALRGTACKAFINVGTFTEFVYGAGKNSYNNLYSATKSALRPIVDYYHKEAGYKWINVIVYSPYGRKNYSSKKVVDYLIDAMDSNQPVAFSGGEQKLDFIHVDDMAEFFVRLISRIDDIHDDFTELHLGTGECHSIREVARIIEQVFNKRINAEWGKLPYRENEAMHTVAPIAAMIKLLKWHPRISLEEGIKILRTDMLSNVNRGGEI